ncbi:MAG: outer membrane protein assembly factor BamC [Gammaproteobacteria bacterium]|nr:MAG: outer membrane protein assembly factor BamC [Gammaproteobacteria bacterium]
MLPDKAVEYKREKQASKNLEVPPDLTSRRFNDRMSVPDNFAGVATSYSEYATDRRLRGIEGRARVGGAVLPEHPKVKEMRDGDMRWLVVDAPADAVWDKLIEFWQDQGILLEEQDPELGIMRTAWLENRANISRDFITEAVRKVFEGLYETSLRDQYRIRLEKDGPNKTEIYLTHYGMEEKLVTDSQGDAENTVWQPRPRDPNLEAIMLRRIKAFLGAADEREQVARKARRPQSQLVQGRDGVKLVVGDEFPRAWRLVGLALDRVGFAVEDRNRSAGVYYVRYNDPATAEESGGLLSKLKFWGDEKPDRETQYQIKLQPRDGATEVVVLNAKSQRDQTPTAKRILKLLQEQLH